MQAQARQRWSGPWRRSWCRQPGVSHSVVNSVHRPSVPPNGTEGLALKDRPPSQPRPVHHTSLDVRLEIPGVRSDSTAVSRNQLGVLLESFPRGSSRIDRRRPQTWKPTLTMGPGAEAWKSRRRSGPRIKLVSEVPGKLPNVTSTLPATCHAEEADEEQEEEVTVPTDRSRAPRGLLALTSRPARTSGGCFRIPVWSQRWGQPQPTDFCWIGLEEISPRRSIVPTREASGSWVSPLDRRSKGVLVAAPAPSLRASLRRGSASSWDCAG